MNLNNNTPPSFESFLIPGKMVVLIDAGYFLKTALISTILDYVKAHYAEPCAENGLDIKSVSKAIALSEVTKENGRDELIRMHCNLPYDFFGDHDDLFLLPNGVDPIEHIVSMASCCINAKNVRTYWYDGISRSAGSRYVIPVQKKPGVVFREGEVKKGRQKGVDSLIVSDIIQFSSIPGITDIVLVTGDSDFVPIIIDTIHKTSVRIHLLHIKTQDGIFPHLSLDLVSNCDNIIDVSFDWGRSFALTDKAKEAVEYKFKSILEEDWVLSLLNKELASESRKIRELYGEKVLRGLVSFSVSAKDILLKNQHDLNSFKSNSIGIPKNLDSKLIFTLRTATGKSDLNHDFIESARNVVRFILKHLLHKSP